MRSVVVLAVVVLGLRSAGFAFGILNIDESDFALVGAQLLHGAVPFRDAADIKPPLTYLLFAPAGLGGGVHLWPVRVLALGWVLLTAALVARAARRWSGDRDAGWAAAWLSVLAGLCELPTVSSELLLNLPSAGALLLFVRVQTGAAALEALACGACIGLASLIRHQGAVLLGALGLAFLLQAVRERSARPLGLAVLLSAGFALPWAATAGLFARLAALPEFYDWVIGRNLFYATGASPGGVFTGALVAIPLCVLGCALPWWFAVRETSRPTVHTPAREGLVLALWTTWLAVAAGFRFYEHYFLHFVPPLAILGAPRAAAFVRDFRAHRPAARILAVAACVLPALGLGGYAWARGFAGAYPSQEPRAREIAAFLRQNTRPDERVFIWGHFSPIYLLAERWPGTRYLTTSMLVGNFDPGRLPPGFDPRPWVSRRDVDFALDDLERRGVDLVIDTAPSGLHAFDRLPLSTVPALESWVRERTELIGEPAGARVYRRVRDARPR